MSGHTVEHTHTHVARPAVVADAAADTLLPENPSRSLRLRASSCRFTLFLLFARALPLPEMNNTEISVTVFLFLCCSFLSRPCFSRTRAARSFLSRPRDSVSFCPLALAMGLFFFLPALTTVLVAQLCVSCVNALGSVLLLSNECFFFGR